MNQLKEMIIPKIEVYRIIPIVMFPQYIRKWKLVLKGSSQIFMPPCFINSGQLFSVHISNNNTCSHQAVLFWITFFPVMIYLFQKWKFPVFWKIVAQFRFVIDAIPVGVDKHRKTVRPKRGNTISSAKRGDRILTLPSIQIVTAYCCDISPTNGNEFRGRYESAD